MSIMPDKIFLTASTYAVGQFTLAIKRNDFTDTIARYEHLYDAQLTVF